MIGRERGRQAATSGAEAAKIGAVRVQCELGAFVRTLVGLDCDAAKKAFANFLPQRNPMADQIEFMNMIVDHLANHGVTQPRLHYESPFTDVSLWSWRAYRQQGAAEVISMAGREGDRPLA